MTESKVYCEDCLLALRKLPDKSVDAIVTDPPYGINITTRHLAKDNNSQFRETTETRRSSAEPHGLSVVHGGYGKGRPPINIPGGGYLYLPSKPKASPHYPA